MAHVATISFFLLLVLVPPFLANGMSSSTRRVPMKLEENVTHLRFYFHQSLDDSRNTTAARLLPPVAPASGRSFGELTVMDNLLTAGPDPTSRRVGRMQGIYASAAMDGMGLLMAMNAVFTDERYGGSSLTFLGRNDAMLEVREMPVVGGTGMFRLARGYVILRTYSYVGTSVIVEYSVCVMHPATSLNMSHT